MKETKKVITQKSELIRAEFVESMLEKTTDYAHLDLFNNQEKERISKIANAVQINIINASEEGKEKEAKYFAIHLVRLALQAVVLTDSKVSEIGLSAKGVCNFLHKKSGFTDLSKWIWKQGIKGEKIKASSGAYQEFRSIEQLFSRDIVNEFPSFTELKKRVEDLRGWLELVSFLVVNESQTLRMTLKKHTKPVEWDKNLICMTFILQLTLGRTKRNYSLDDIREALDIINKDYDEWAEHIIKQAEHSQNQQIEYLLHNAEFKKHISNLKSPVNRTLLYFRHTVILDTFSMRLLDEYCTTYDKACNFLRLKKYKNGTHRSHNNKLFYSEVSKYLMRQSFKDVCLIFRSFPSLISNELESKFFRKCSVYDKGEIKIIADKYSMKLPEEFEYSVLFMKTKYSRAEILRSFWEDKNPIGMDIGYFSKNRISKTISTAQSVNRNTEVVKLASKTCSLAEFMQLVETSYCNPQDIPLEIALVFYLVDNNLTKKSIDRLGSTGWFNFVDTNLLVKFNLSFAKLNFTSMKIPHK